MVRVNNLLEVKDLQIVFEKEKKELVSVDNVSFSLKRGETLGIVGESGCGKSVTSLSIMRLLGKNGRIRQGEVLFAGEDIAHVSDKRIRELRGNEISMIFQEPMTSLNPVLTIGDQMMESIRLHMKLDKKAARQYAIEMLEKVRIPRAEVIIDEYPHGLSGGMRQRVMIAMALSCKPKLLIADEPTTALDVTIQAQILKLMQGLREESDTSIMLITHDLGVIAEMADRVIVMYAGQVVEEAEVFELFDNPKHPYTKGLMASIPHIEFDGNERLVSIPGTVPSLDQMPQGCRFQSRCSFATDKCIEQQPSLTQITTQHAVRCFLYESGEE